MVTALIRHCWVLAPGYPTPLSPWDVAGITWSLPGLLPFAVPSIYTQVKWEQFLPHPSVGRLPGHQKPSELLVGVFRDKVEAEQEFLMELQQAELFWHHEQAH